MESCAKHPHEVGAALCGRCGYAWCASCLVYAHGHKKPPYCMECAMFAGGVRSAAVRPALSRREMRARIRQVEAAAADQRDGERPQAAAAVVVDLSDSATPEPDGTDWFAPWPEERQPTYIG